MPERTFCRRFLAQIGNSPARWLIGQRVIAAQRLLETTALPVESIADRIGMGSAANLRHHFRAHHADAVPADVRGSGPRASLTFRSGQTRGP